ncbi:prosaposin-like [Patiria miniata]|uniref:Saposin B-type domain-containing protein n=1 Tax=Patiria miniata TaxID=46514 RepID=A0A914A9T6_PATMI|nr:prosaposin-like [Patiria miniata]
MNETQLATNKRFEEVTDLIEKVCPLLPGSLNQQCKGFLDIYGPVLLKLIVDSELSPICKDLGLCTPSSLLQPRLRLTVGSVQCDACRTVVTVIEDSVKFLVKEIADIILELLAKLCDLLPQTYQQECKNLVESFGSYIVDLVVDLIVEFLSPDTICEALMLCSESRKSLPPANNCMLGPVFWCASMDNAKLCNTVEHCRRHAWN